MGVSWAQGLSGDWVGESNWLSDGARDVCGDHITMVACFCHEVARKLSQYFKKLF